MHPWKLNLSEVPEEHSEQRFQDHFYERYRRRVSLALGNVKGSNHPFDVEVTRLPPGVAACPIHRHELWWEFFAVISGRGEVHRNGEVHQVAPGDCFIQPPGTRHRIRNSSASEDLVYYVIANEVAVRDSGTPLEV